MSKYAPLGEYLERQQGDQVRLSFGQLENLLGFRLPKSAYSQRAWWSNNPDNNVMTKVWRRARFLTKSVDMDKHMVVFMRQKPKPPLSDGQKAEQAKSRESLADLAARNGKRQAVRHPLRGALKGHLRLVGGTDLTKPADPHWGDT